MSQYTGYTGDCLEFLKTHHILVGDSVKILVADIVYFGIIMSRYEHNDDKHVVLKLRSGYNIGLEITHITSIEKLSTILPADKKLDKVKNSKGLPKILLLSTGGTIASKIDYRTGAVTPTLSADELNASVPELGEIADIDTQELFSEYSENIMPEHWLEIAKTIDKYSKSEYVGVIVAHGTDTMHYTSAFLSFALAGFALPIALVGSQRSSDRASSDAALNLMGAAKFLTECKTNGVYVVMHQDENDNTIACHAGTRVRKNHTSKRGAFETIGDNPAFLVVNDTVYKNTSNDFFTDKKYNPQINLDDKVALLKYHPGYDPAMMQQIINAKYRAIIFEGTGLGHVGRNMYDVIKTAKEKGIFMGMTSQCIDGKISMTVYESGRDLLDLGIIPLENMIPEVALVKAMWAAGNSNDADGIKKLLLHKSASEFWT